VRAVYEIRPPAWGETLAILQSVSLPDGPERVRAKVVEVEGDRVTVDFPALDGETSAEQLLAACVAGEWADRGDVDSCRLVEVAWPGNCICGRPLLHQVHGAAGKQLAVRLGRSR